MAFLKIDTYLLVQAVLYFSCAVTCMVVCVATAYTVMVLGGECLLYSHVSWQNQTYLIWQFAPKSTCSLVTYHNGIAGLLLGLAFGSYYTYGTYKSRVDTTIWLQMWTMPCLLVSSLVSFVTFIAACVLSVGLTTFCHSFLNGRLTDDDRYNKCSDIQKFHDPAKRINYTHVHDYVSTAQVACWVAFLLWALQVGLTMFRYIWNRRQRRQDDGGLSISASDTRRIASVEPTA